MIKKYPRTIINPEAFEREKAADFDGVFDWDFLRAAFPRGIMPMDIDASIEINGWFLQFETKPYGGVVIPGQMMAIRAATRNLHHRFKIPHTRYILLWGKGGGGGEQPTKEWNHCVNGAIWPKRKQCTPEQVVRFTAAWAACADRCDFSLLIETYRHFGLKEPGPRSKPRQTEMLLPLEGKAK